MVSLSKEEVLRIAKLARLNLTDEELEKFPTELTNILSFISTLSEVDTSTVAPTAQVTGLKNGFRKDELYKEPFSGDELLSTSPLVISEHQIQTPSAHG